MSTLGVSREELKRYSDSALEHVTHCVEYLRQTILCSADTSFEGNPSVEWGTGPGAEHKHKHVCRDYDELIHMATDRAVWNVRVDVLSLAGGR